MCQRAPEPPGTAGFPHVFNLARREIAGSWSAVSYSFQVMGLMNPIARQTPKIAPAASRNRQSQTAFRSPKVLAIQRPFDV